MTLNLAKFQIKQQCLPKSGYQSSNRSENIQTLFVIVFCKIIAADGYIDGGIEANLDCEK